MLVIRCHYRFPSSGLYGQFLDALGQPRGGEFLVRRPARNLCSACAPLNAPSSHAHPSLLFSASQVNTVTARSQYQPIVVANVIFGWYKGFDIILDHSSRISQPCTIPPALCGLVAMRMEC